MPQRRRLTDKQEAQALAEFEADPRRGKINQLAAKYGLSWHSMQDCLNRARARGTQLEVSREPSNSDQGGEAA